MALPADGRSHYQHGNAICDDQAIGCGITDWRSGQAFQYQTREGEPHQHADLAGQYPASIWVEPAHVVSWGQIEKLTSL